MLSEIFEAESDPSLDLVKNSSGNANAAGVSQALNPSSNVYTVTVDALIGQPAVFYVEGSPWGEDFMQTLEAEGLMP